MALLFSAPVWASGGKSSGAVTIKVKLSPAGSFEAKSEQVTVVGASIEGSVYKAAEIRVPIASFDTGMALRNEHFQKRLGYPDVKDVVVSNVVVEKGKAGKYTIQIAKNKPKTFANLSTHQEEQNPATASFDLELDQFDIKDVRYMGVGVKNSVTIEVSIDKSVFAKKGGKE